MFQVLPGLALLSLAVPSFAAPQGIYQRDQNATTLSSINWSKCTGVSTNTTLPVQCGSLMVPLDYTKPNSSQQLELKLVRAKATKQPFKGSVLTNPGGPGGVGREFLANAASQLLKVTGGQFDIISFDPRGTGDTIPFDCYVNDPLERVASSGGPSVVGETDTSIGTIWSKQTAYTRSCYKAQNKTGALVGTAFVARDMMQIVDALNEDGMLRYLGFSYGTLLGATVAAMFPDRMDKVILDGVVNAQEYYAGTPTQELTSTDAAFASFLDKCFAAKEACKLTKYEGTAQAMNTRISLLLDTLRILPLALGDKSSEIVTYGMLKSTMFQALYAPNSRWPALASLIDAVLSRNLREYEQAMAVLGESNEETIFPNLGTDTLLAVHCGESGIEGVNLTSVLPLVKAVVATSKLAGDGLAASETLTCPQWRFAAKERYLGNFQVTTKNPILFIGNPLDPVTPLISARSTSAGFVGSVVLQHNGEGHTSLSQSSLCTINAMQKYFMDGTLPAPGTQCNPEKPGFPVPSNSTSSSSRIMVRHADKDTELLEAAEQIGNSLPFFRRF